MPPDTHRAIHAVWRLESARLIAGLTRFVRDIGIAEELAQDALVAALEQWPTAGVPNNPGAWLMTTAKHRAIDHLRRVERHGRKHVELGHAIDARQDSPAAVLDAALDDDVGDDLLRLVFTSCHPALSSEARVALTLRLLGGLTTQEIARAYLVPEPTIAQRIVRAKRTLAEENVPFEVPRGPELAARLASVLEVIYLIFNHVLAGVGGERRVELQDLVGGDERRRRDALDEHLLEERREAVRLPAHDERVLREVLVLAGRVGRHRARELAAEEGRAAGERADHGRGEPQRRAAHALDADQLGAAAVLQQVPPAGDDPDGGRHRDRARIGGAAPRGRDDRRAHAVDGGRAGDEQLRGIVGAAAGVEDRVGRRGDDERSPVVTQRHGPDRLRAGTVRDAVDHAAVLRRAACSLWEMIARLTTRSASRRATSSIWRSLSRDGSTTAPASPRRKNPSPRSRAARSWLARMRWCST
ncbi:sigma-70 family RNA polymerase sigma factor [Nannocystis sp. ILAH1]|uniref:sigma-70 family RNA polymerase sigma factor n=1 Tax=Nannocystis sp. ILAH1 TaxID=2996789 RepID=UPI00226DD81A|nr:sigma-70 family RNA polymerase sigma factor [Nannocystis sp. ILAH1]MCY0992827.1 sigma-70 family RNA polymerase sigma factor [Nannocystis sp. ILAH1]